MKIFVLALLALSATIALTQDVEEVPIEQIDPPIFERPIKPGGLPPRGEIPKT